MQGNPLVVHKRFRTLGGSLRRPIQVQALANHQHRQDRRVAAACRRVEEETLEASGRLRIGHGVTLMFGHAQSFKTTQEVGVLVARNLAGKLRQAQATRESIGVSNRATNQGEEGIEETVVLHQVPRHDLRGDRAVKKLSNKAVIRGGKPGVEVLLAQRLRERIGANQIGEGCGHDGCLSLCGIPSLVCVCVRVCWCGLRRWGRRLSEYSTVTPRRARFCAPVPANFRSFRFFGWVRADDAGQIRAIGVR